MKRIDRILKAATLTSAFIAQTGSNALASEDPQGRFIANTSEIGACFEDIHTLITIELQDDEKVAETIMAEANFLFETCSSDLANAIDRYEMFFLNRYNPNVDRALYNAIDLMDTAEQAKERARVKWIDLNNRVPADSQFDPRIEAIRSKREEQIDRGRLERLMALE